MFKSLRIWFRRRADPQSAHSGVAAGATVQSVTASTAEATACRRPPVITQHHAGQRAKMTLAVLSLTIYWMIRSAGLADRCCDLHLTTDRERSTLPCVQTKNRNELTAAQTMMCGGFKKPGCATVKLLTHSTREYLTTSGHTIVDLNVDGIKKSRVPACNYGTWCRRREVDREIAISLRGFDLNGRPRFCSLGDWVCSNTPSPEQIVMMWLGSWRIDEYERDHFRRTRIGRSRTDSSLFRDWCTDDGIVSVVSRIDRHFDSITRWSVTSVLFSLIRSTIRN